MANNKVAILSHEEDADGIVSAALSKHWTDGSVYLTDYPRIISTLRKIRNVDMLYISDLGVNAATFDEFLGELERLKSKGMEVVYIDHHEISSSQHKKVARLTDYHRGDECASVLTHDYFFNLLPSKSTPFFDLIPSFGAVMDYLDSQPIANNIIMRTDRPFILQEATVLGYAIQYLQKPEWKKCLPLIVDWLCQQMYPHQMTLAMTWTNDALATEASMLETLPSQATATGNIAYFDCTNTAFHALNVASALRLIKKVPVAVGYERDGNIYKISLRATANMGYNVADIAREVASKVGGSGGGHPLAAGASCPVKMIDKFIDLVEDKVLWAPPD